ncbi:MAG: FAD/NAD(P)-binding protein [Candidatus Devosia phytovorans]|uniref:FAD/NAD(P)-binding protein n=1 Tax=Candidatus Devosia phytovorans TaxID=3121372 RepID=A0AAJ5VSC5_9HYPH|nr:FAD/NAD(P)-binding protein [Devosia sp.]WEK03854.1 MAG: FAD/NAD(P)-binding protein [Devosia sp.]
MTGVTIIGGGASGVLLAAHLLRDPASDVTVTLIERAQLGQGVAYSASQHDHRVNVPARGMSAFADDPDHFSRWLQSRGHPPEQCSWVFVPRRLYGTYLRDLLKQAGEANPGRLTVLQDEVLSVGDTPEGMQTVLANGTVLPSRQVVLAVGHETHSARSRGIAVRVGSEDDTVLPTEAQVMILGSGLSMVDAWVSLSDAKHIGPITVISRNGLLPKGHQDVKPLTIAEGDVPFGSRLVHWLRWFRGLIHDTEAAGGDWRSVVDGIRPYNQRIWQSWSRETRRQFLRHLRPWWNIHRHRLPPELYERIAEGVASGQVRLVAGEFVTVTGRDLAAEAEIRRRGTAIREIMPVARVYDCGGVSVNVEASSNPVIRDLVASGRGRPDELRIGLDVNEHCAVIDTAGNANDSLLAIGPLTRGRFFEIEAIPDIRVQAANIARSILENERSRQS